MKNPNLDFSEFAAKIIKSVDNIRSFGNSSTNLPSASSSKPTESRINAFYRLLGLPSIRLAQSGSAQANKDTSRLDTLNTGNQFTSSDMGMTDNELSNRHNIRETRFLLKVSEAEAKAFLNNNKSKLDDGVPEGNAAEGLRKRGTLFPMIVFGEIPIFPQNRRISDAFMPKSERMVEDTEYPAPFIEAVILIRLKGKGVVDAALQTQLQDDFGITSQELNAMETTIVNAIATSTNTIIHKLSQAAVLINESSKEYMSYAIPNVGLVAEARQEFNKNIESAGAIEKRQEREEASRRLREATMFAMDFSDDGTNNMKDTSMVSDLMSLVATQESTDGRKNEVQHVSSKTGKDVSIALEKTQRKARTAFRDLEFLLGTFGGLSGVDVIVIIEALFTIPLDSLIGLLNDSARQRLKSLKQYDVSSAPAVSTAVATLENKVREIYKRISTGASIRKHRDKIPNKGN